ncbi:hypothetical protein EDD59_12429 [Muricomes intestini]|jgi:hypothetical protein|uniref:Uncharacterized protein n=1 Tax=Muricomes intestini TaxID=1796634 RepID=A0A4R3K2E7_9FIRM|nr:hypothetical protein EDD59_12429 [Muricomes intestini]
MPLICNHKKAEFFRKIVEESKHEAMLYYEQGNTKKFVRRTV